MDVCIILANALDNSIKACLKDNKTKPDITITVQPRYQFLLMEVTNSISSTVTISYGTGLTNIRRTAENYIFPICRTPVNCGILQGPHRSFPKKDILYTAIMV